MSFKPTDKHWEIILSYLEKYPEMATGRCNAINGKQKLRKIWEELAKILNGLGFGAKSADKWHKTWVDFKYNLKKKANEIKKDQGKTGGGKGSMTILNEFELRALQLLGPSFAEGIGRQEVGLQPSCSKVSGTDYSLPPSPSLLSSHCSYYWNEGNAETINNNNIISPEEMENPASFTALQSFSDPHFFKDTPCTPVEKINKNMHIPENSTENVQSSTYKKRKAAISKVDLDHSYTPKKARAYRGNGNIDNYYSETISLLRDINNTIDRRLGQIYDVLSLLVNHNMNKP